MAAKSKNDLLEQIRDLEARLAEAEETLRALRSGEVDAVVASGPDGERVYTLKGADEAYRVMVENMAEGALTLSPDGLILFSNEQFATLVGIPLERVIGSSLRDLIPVEDAFVLSAVLSTSTRAEAQLRLKKESATLVPVHLSASRLWFEGIECVCLVVTDLTEQKRNQEIVAAERLASSILEQAAGALLVINPTGRIIRASLAAQHLAHSPVLLRQFDDVFRLRVNSDAIAESIAMDYTFDEIFSTVRRHGKVADLEATLRLDERRKLDVIVSAGLLTGADGDCLGCIVLISDVSGLKRIEQALRESEARLRSLGDNLPEGAIFRVCQQSSGKVYFDFMSAGVELLTGVSAADIMNDAEALLKTIPADDLNRMMAAVDVSREKLARLEIELRHTHALTGEVRWALARSMPSRRPDGSTAWEGIEFDITERKRAEEALRESEARLRALITASSDALYRMSPDWSEMRQLSGGNFLSDTKLPTRTWLQKYIHPDDQSRVMAVIEEAIRSKGVFELEHPVLRVDGTWGWTFSRAIPLLDAHGEIVEWFGAASDVTERRRAEEEVRRLNAELEQRVRSRTAALEAANKELEAFAYSVAHDLHSPLRGIDGWSLALIEDYGPQLDEMARGLLERVRSEAQHMGRLIDGLLHLSRIGRTEILPRDADLSSLVETIAARLKGVHPDRVIDFVIQPGLKGTGDGHLLEIALTNLLDNAVKFTQSRTLALIEVGKIERNGKPAFFVRDNGVGFDMQHSGMLFGTFQRLHKSVEYPGTGVGLATVKRIIDRHGGEVWAEGRLSEGATFYFTLESRHEGHDDTARRR